MKEDEFKRALTRASDEAKKAKAECEWLEQHLWVWVWVWKWVWVWVCESSIQLRMRAQAPAIARMASISTPVAMLRTNPGALLALPASLPPSLPAYLPFSMLRVNLAAAG